MRLPRLLKRRSGDATLGVARVAPLKVACAAWYLGQGAFGECAKEKRPNSQKPQLKYLTTGMPAKPAGKLIATWRRRRARVLGFGVGIVQGYATPGQIGFADRSGYTAIGVCNLGARRPRMDSSFLLSASPSRSKRQRGSKKLASLP